MSSDTPEIILNPSNVARLQNFMNDPGYRETIENASRYNSQLAADRTMRLPWLDSQTGVAQNHSNLWMDARQRIPGLREGQIYSYPSSRWRKKRRQYLNNFLQPRYPNNYPISIQRKEVVEEPQPPLSLVEAMTAGPSSVLNEDSHSRDSTKDDSQGSNKPEAWYYDDLDIPDAGEFDEPDADSDYDYEESFSKRKKKKPPVKATRQTSSRGRRKITYDAVTDPEKPFSCDICGARYKTRPGLTYHYTHSHKDKEDEEEEEAAVSASPKRDRDDGGNRRHNNRGLPPTMPPHNMHQQHQHHMMQLQPPTLQPQQPSPHHMMHMSGPGGPHPGELMPPPHMPHSHHHPPPPHLIAQQQPPPNHGQMGMLRRGESPPTIPTPLLPGAPRASDTPPSEESSNEKKPLDNLRPRVQPSPYCDFCLGDAVENKKSGVPEELVSCSDCGRSGHPTCLQFTANMIISVKKYRWQCIECKCCSICGTSDNDDQLLFCDDCDRGYHMYCLMPPLDAPPEGSWSCTLCLAEFHQK